ncbi:MAG: HNH endonuclease [Gammaproteobacteria bacterium]|nr:HNH endonuclease [Gammaproteobacteria bacterium]MCY4345006.1 HNH endonuclease [Gammaproteobacteria bacterium]
MFNLYCRIPFNVSNRSHPDVQHVARLINRTPDAVNMKIGNFGSLDPELGKRGIRGLANASHLDQATWDEFHADWSARIDESQKLISQREKALGVRTSNHANLAHADTALEGEDRVVSRRVRVNQHFFRQAVLSAYDYKCCITGIDLKTVLIASHIKSWKESNNREKLNPQNGLCLNALHDRAFDRGLIAVNDDYTVAVSSLVSQSLSDAVRSMLLWYESREIKTPSRFLPCPEFLQWHRDNVFEQ